MTLKWYDGAEALTADLSYESGTATRTSSDPRVAPGQYSWTGATALRTPSLGVDNTWTVGLGWKPSVATDGFRIRFLRGGSEQCRLESVVNGSQVQFRLMRGAVEIATTAASYAADIWHYIELKVLILDGTGTYELRVNEVSQMSDTGVDLVELASTGADQIEIDPDNGLLDDIYICDGVGAGPDNTFLGDVACVAVLPNADGATNDWTPSTGATNYERVDDPVDGDDGESVSTGTAGHIDLYGFANLPATGIGQIFGVSVVTKARLDAIGSETCRPKFRSFGGVVADGDDFVVASTGTLEYPVVLPENPATAAGWVQSDIDDGQFGIEKVS